MTNIPSPKATLIAGMTGIVVLGGLAACVAPSSPTPASTPSAPASQDYSSSNDYDADEYQYEPEYTCANLRSEMTQMSEEQYTSSTTLLVGIKQFRTVKDNQLNPPRNGWVLECEGTAIWSGDPNSRLTYGVKAEGGQLFASYKEQPSW